MRLIPFIILLQFAMPLSAQQQLIVDFSHAKVEISPEIASQKIEGEAIYTFNLVEAVDSIHLDAISMNFKGVMLNDRAIDFSNNGRRFSFQAPEKPGQYQLRLSYTCSPQQTVYFTGMDDEIVGNEQIWTQGQGKYTSHWLPSFDDMNEKLEFDLTFHLPSKYKVIANGTLKNTEINGNLKTWRFDMVKPMSSYLVAFTIGDFEKKVIHSKSGIPIELHYEPKDSLKVEPTYRHTKAIFDFLEEEIGLPYPWQNYKQVPVQDFLYAGMENTGCTLFSNQYVIDSVAFEDKNYVNVNAHELAHQWFGNLVTEQSGKHHWLHEGFATYYAYLAEKALFGDDHFFWKLFDTAMTLQNLSENGDGEALTNPNANSLTFYEKGAWALVLLKERVGEEAFRKGVKKYLVTYGFKNVTIDDFLSEVELASQTDLYDFREKWLENEEFPIADVRSFLSKNAPSIKLVLEMEEEIKGIGIDNVAITEYWNAAEGSVPFKKYLIRKYYKQLPKALLLNILDSKQSELRKAITLAAPNAEGFPQDKFESLLTDSSYMTKENALFKLWATYPEERTRYLDSTAGMVGFPNKNIRLLWLTLALITQEFQPENKRQFFEELNAYTNKEYHFEVRQLAFQYLNEINALNDNSLLNLIEANSHHVWQFKKSARNLLRDLVKVKAIRERLKLLEKTMPSEQKEVLQKVLNP